MAGDEARTCPSWIDEFLDDVGAGIDTGAVPAAYSVWGPDDPDADEDLSDPWVVYFYPSLSQVVGGANDGAVVYPGLSVDLLSLQEYIEDIEELRFSSGNSVSATPFRGCVLEVEGWYDGHPVCLKIFDKPPSDAKVDSIIHPNFVHVVQPEELGR
jgi:hypothetical protein